MKKSRFTISIALTSSIIAIFAYLAFVARPKFLRQQPQGNSEYSLSNRREPYGNNGKSLKATHLLWDLQDGSEWVYNFDYQSVGSAKITFSRQGSASSDSKNEGEHGYNESYSFRLTGSLALHFISAAKNNWKQAQLSVVLTSSSMTIGSNPIATHALGDLRANFNISTLGSIQNINFSQAESTQLGQNVMRSLLALWRTKIGLDVQPPQQLTWQSEERLPFGESTITHELRGQWPGNDFAAAFAAANLELPAQISTTLGSYGVVFSSFSSPDVNHKVFGNSSRVIGLDPLVPVAILANISSEQHLGNNGAISSSTQLKMQLNRYIRGKDPISHAWPNPDKENAALDDNSLDATPSTASANTNQSNHERDFLATRLKNATPESIAHELALLEEKRQQNTLSVDEQTSIYLQIKALIALHPEAIAALANILQQASSQSLAFEILAGAFHASKDPRANDALARVAQARQSDASVLLQLMPMLALETIPGKKAEELLLYLAWNDVRLNVRSSARLALGTAAHALAAAGENPRATSLTKLATEALARAGSDNEKVEWLAVIGNIGRAETTATLLSFLSLQYPPNIRAAAAFALRLHSDRESEASLIKLLTDSDGSVRQRAAQALSYRPTQNFSSNVPDQITAQIKAFERERELNISLTMLRSIWKRASTNPNVRTWITQVANTHPEADIKKLATSLSQNQISN